AGDDRDPLPAVEPREREAVAQRTEKLRRRALRQLFEESRPGTDAAKKELDLARIGSGVGDGVGAAEVGPRPPGQVEHDELPGQDRLREGGRVECDGKEVGGEDLAANQEDPVIGSHQAGILVPFQPDVTKKKRWLRGPAYCHLTVSLRN